MALIKAFLFKASVQLLQISVISTLHVVDHQIGASDKALASFGSQPTMIFLLLFCKILSFCYSKQYLLLITKFIVFQNELL